MASNQQVVQRYFILRNNRMRPADAWRMARTSRKMQLVLQDMRYFPELFPPAILPAPFKK